VQSAVLQIRQHHDKKAKRPKTHLRASLAAFPGALVAGQGSRTATLRQAPPGCRLPPMVVRHSADLPLIHAAFTTLNIEPSPQGDMRCIGSEYMSPSKVGIHITGWKSCNGRQFWKYEDQNTKDWKFISDLRA
jgi:hypothetical protein